MLPGVYEFRWDAGHVIFLGAFYGVLLLIAGSVLIALLQTLRDLRGNKADEIRWGEEFRALPASSRLCRHAMTGELQNRVCPNCFDCGHCLKHQEMLQARGREPRAGRSGAIGETTIGGFSVPLDRLYHRGHTWVKPEPDGEVTIGLDDMATRLMGRPDRVVLPAKGARIRANGTGWRLRKRGADVRVLAPISGEVIATGSHAKGWYLKVRPESGGSGTDHLLCGAEVAAWLLREMERLQGALRSTPVGATMADGGLPVRRLARAIPESERDAILGEMLLDP